MMSIKLTCIPPSTRRSSYRRVERIKEDYQMPKKPVHFTKRSTTFLKKMLDDAISLREHLQGVLQVLPSDEAIDKFDKIDKAIRQLTLQIAVREGK